MATFDRARFAARLATRRLGRTLLARAAAGSTNDVAWEALAAGTPDGTAVVADHQTAGRGRAGRVWHSAPGLGLALSVALHAGCERGLAPLLPLAAGLALARALDQLGARAALKWPNDLLLGGRKVSGILAESRGGPAESLDRVVIGTGVNVLHRAGDFPPGLATLATSLALHGVATTREDVAALYLNQLEPLWTALQEGGGDGVVAAWRGRAGFWGEAVRVTTPTGPVAGIARDLDPGGALVLETAGGARVRVLAGDVAAAAPGGA